MVVCLFVSGLRQKVRAAAEETVVVQFRFRNARQATASRFVAAYDTCPVVTNSNSHTLPFFIFLHVRFVTATEGFFYG